MKKIHKDYQEIIVFTVVFAFIFLIFLLLGLASDLAYFWIAGLVSILIVTIRVAISHAVKKRKIIMDDGKITQSFYSYWPYEHPPWM